MKRSGNQIITCLRRRMRAEAGNIMLLLSGSLSLALGVTLFLQPNQIASGGTPGMAILLCHLSGLTLGTVMLAINIPLLVIACCYLGQSFVWRTVVTVVLISGLVDLCNEAIGVTALTRSPLVAALCGGAAIGVGVGLILRGNASAGGPTIIARIISTRSRIRPGQVILAIDILIVLSSVFVFGALAPAAWSLVSVIVTGRCVDLALGHFRLRRLQESFAPVTSILLPLQRSGTARPE